ncbi:hypothetical protein HYV86_04125 [Candidatus Woesearchaeota archaeon]|nr:hypothetical protein [Candidatus Woesearchaeota archaeon]
MDLISKLNITRPTLSTFDLSSLSIENTTENGELKGRIAEFLLKAGWQVAKELHLITIFLEQKGSIQFKGSEAEF